MPTGYWPSDFYKTNPAFGSTEDLKDLLAAYKENGEFDSSSNGQMTCNAALPADWDAVLAQTIVGTCDQLCHCSPPISD